MLRYEAYITVDPAVAMFGTLDFNIPRVKSMYLLNFACTAYGQDIGNTAFYAVDSVAYITESNQVTQILDMTNAQVNGGVLTGDGLSFHVNNFAPFSGRVEIGNRVGVSVGWYCQPRYTPVVAGDVWTLFIRLLIDTDPS